MMDWIDPAFLWSLISGIDWYTFLFGDGTKNLCDELVLGRYVVSVSGVTAGLRYGEIVFDDVTSPGNAHGIHAGVRLLSTAGRVRSGMCVSSSGRIWFSDAALDTPDHTDGPTFTAGQVAMFAVNNTNGKCWLGKVGTGWYASGDPAAGTGQVVTLATGLFHLGAALEVDGTPPTAGAQFSLRTQSSQFTGSIPSGFSAWYP
jgi:hypothetical protein